MVLAHEHGPSDFEQYIGKHLAPVIPIVTIANPAASLNRSIVPRLEVENDAWATAVRLLLGAAHFIVIEPARNSTGVCLELDLTKEFNRHPDTIIVLASEKTRQRMDEMRKSMTVWVDAPVGPTSKFLLADDAILSGFPRVVSDDLFGDRDPATIRVFQDVLPKNQAKGPDDYTQRRLERDTLRSEGILLHKRGVELLDSGQLAEASDVLKSAANSFEKCHDCAYRAMPLNYLGKVARAREDFSKAEICFTAAAEIQRETGPPMEYIGSLHHLALARLGLNARDRAQMSFEEMRRASQLWGYGRGEARAVEGLAMIALASGDRATALEKLREAVELCSDPRDQASIRQTLNLAEQAVSSSAPIPEDGSKLLTARNEVVSTYNDAVRELETGNTVSAIDKLNRALAAASNSAMTDLRQTILFRLGMAYSQAAQNDSAIDALRQSAALANELNDPAQVAVAQSNIGALLVRNGKVQDGIDELKRAEQSQRAQSDEANLAYTLNALGNAYFKLREYDVSLKWDEEALRLHRAQNHLAQINVVMERMGLAQMYLGKDEQARSTMLETAKLAGAEGRKEQQATQLAMAAKLSSNLGDLEQSSALFAQSIAIWQELGDENSAAKVHDFAQRALESRQKE
jgi:tetratricopeptide (TPR) repeat protein